MLLADIHFCVPNNLQWVWRLFAVFGIITKLHDPVWVEPQLADSCLYVCLENAKWEQITSLPPPCFAVEYLSSLNVKMTRSYILSTAECLYFKVLLASFLSDTRNSLGIFSLTYHYLWGCSIQLGVCPCFTSPLQGKMGGKVSD